MSSQATCKRMPKKILHLALGIYNQEGGIERYNQRVLRVYASLLETGDIGAVRVLSLWDDEDSARRAPTGIELIPGASNKLRVAWKFLLQVVCDAPDILIYSHLYLKPLSVIAHILRPKTRQILLIYGVEAWDAPNRVLRWIVRTSIDTTVSISKFTADIFKDQYQLDAARFQLLPCAIDVKEPPEGVVRMPGEDAERVHQLITVSRLSTQDTYKNIDKVILSLPIVHETFSNICLAIVGDGDWKAELELLAREHALENHVTFFGRVSDSVRNQLVQEADVFVLPSTGEGFGIVYLEAWLLGLPVIGGNEAGAAEVIAHGEDGICVVPTPRAIAEAIVRLLCDEALRTQFAQHGRMRVAEEYSHEYFQARLTSILVDG